ncbi:MAG: DUF5681 domain-containing protein [Hyphomonadaceae bacterium]
MSEHPPGPDRRANGTFQKGSSGNRRGRPRRKRRIPHPEKLRDMIYDVVEFKIAGEIKGQRYELNLMQANMLTLGMAGAAGDARSAQAFLDKIHRVTDQEQRDIERWMKQLEGVIPDYYYEEDEKSATCSTRSG